jgi:hypothetical protein
MTNQAWTRRLIIATVLISAFAGELIDRALVATPAWNALGPSAWGDYSRHADLGNGLIIYPIYGIGLLSLAVATAVTYRLDRRAPWAAGLPIYLAAVSAVGVMATTVKAAPIMLGVRNLGTDTVALRHAFDQFTFWGVEVRGVFAVLAFLASVWALAVYPRQTSNEGSHSQVHPGGTNAR